MTGRTPGGSTWAAAARRASPACMAIRRSLADCSGTRWMPA